MATPAGTDRYRQSIGAPRFLFAHTRFLSISLVFNRPPVFPLVIVSRPRENDTLRLLFMHVNRAGGNFNKALERLIVREKTPARSSSQLLVQLPCVSFFPPSPPPPPRQSIARVNVLLKCCLSALGSRP